MQPKTQNPLKRTREETGATYADDEVQSQKRTRYQPEGSAQPLTSTNSSRNGLAIPQDSGALAKTRSAGPTTAAPLARTAHDEAAYSMPLAQNTPFSMDNTTLDQMPEAVNNFPSSAKGYNHPYLHEGQNLTSCVRGRPGNGVYRGIQHHSKQPRQDGPPYHPQAPGFPAIFNSRPFQSFPAGKVSSPPLHTLQSENPRSYTQTAPDATFSPTRYSQRPRVDTPNRSNASTAVKAALCSQKALGLGEIRAQKRMLKSQNTPTSTSHLVSPPQGLNTNRVLCTVTTQSQVDFPNLSNSTNTGTMPYFKERVIGAVGINPNLRYNPSLRPGQPGTQVQPRGESLPAFSNWQDGVAATMETDRQSYLQPPTMLGSSSAYFGYSHAFENNGFRMSNQQNDSQVQFAQTTIDPSLLQLNAQETAYFEQMFDQAGAPPHQEMYQQLPQSQIMMQPLYNIPLVEPAPAPQVPQPQHNGDNFGNQSNGAAGYSTQQSQPIRTSTDGQTPKSVIDLTDDSSDAVSTPFSIDTPATTASPLAGQNSSLTPIDLTTPPRTESVKTYERPKRSVHVLQYIEEDEEQPEKIHGYISVAGDEGFPWIGNWIEHEQEKGTFAKDLATKIIFPEFTSNDGPCPKTVFVDGRPSRKFYELTLWVFEYREKIRISDERLMAYLEGREKRRARKATRKAKGQELQGDAAEIQARRSQHAANVAERKANKVSRRMAAAKNSEAQLTPEEAEKRKEAARLQKLEVRRERAAEQRRATREANSGTTAKRKSKKAADSEVHLNDDDDDELERAIIAEFEDANAEEAVEESRSRRGYQFEINIEDYLMDDSDDDDDDASAAEVTNPVQPASLVAPKPVAATQPKPAATEPSHKAKSTQDYIEELNNYKPAWKLAEEAAEKASLEAKLAPERAAAAAAAELQRQHNENAHTRALDTRDHSDRVNDGESDESEAE